MNWIKVDADHMPPDVERVIVTYIGHLNKKQVSCRVRWNKNSETWQIICDGQYDYENFLCTVTHWMPYPEPAQD